MKLIPFDETNDKLDHVQKPHPEFINTVGTYLIGLVSGYYSRVLGGFLDSRDG